MDHKTNPTKIVPPKQPVQPATKAEETVKKILRQDLAGHASKVLAAVDVHPC